jgi:hypothetical protein
MVTESLAAVTPASFKMKLCVLQDNTHFDALETRGLQNLPTWKIMVLWKELL